MITIRSEIVRILSNYSRLLLGFLCGLILVRTLLGYGQAVYSVYALVTVGAGVGIMLRELLRISLVPHLSKGWHHKGDGSRFSSIYTGSMSVALLTALFGMLLMAVLLYNFHKFDIDKDVHFGAYAYVLSRTYIMVLAVCLTPMFAMLQIQQRFGESNGLILLERVGDLVAAIAPLYLLSDYASGSEVLLIFSIITALLYTALYIYSYIRIVSRSSVLKPSYLFSIPTEMRALANSIIWATLLVVSINLYFRFNTLFVNLQFGETATIVFAISIQLIGMIRQLTVGITNGLDAVFASASNAGRDGQKTKVLVSSSYLQTIVIASTFVFFFFNVDVLLKFWVGDRVELEAIKTVSELTMLMMLGISFKAIAEIWMSSLNGTNQISHYVNYTFPVSLLNPAILCIAVVVFSEYLSIYFVAVLYVVLMLISYALIVPIIYARRTNTRIAVLFRPVVRGMFAPVCCFMALMFMFTQTTIAIYLDTIYAPLVTVFVLGATVALDFGCYFKFRKNTV